MDIEVDLSEMEQEQAEQPRPVTQPTPRKPEPAEPVAAESPKAEPVAETESTPNSDGIDDNQFSHKSITRDEFETIRRLALRRLSEQDQIMLSKLMHGVDVSIWQLAIAGILGGTRPQYLAEQASIKAEIDALKSVIAGAEKSADKNFETSKANIANFAAVAQKIQQANSEFYERYMVEGTKRIEKSTAQLHAKVMNHYKNDIAIQIAEKVDERSKGMLMWVVLSVLAGSMVSGLVGFLIGKLV